MRTKGQQQCVSIFTHLNSIFEHYSSCARELHSILLKRKQKKRRTEERKSEAKL